MKFEFDVPDQMTAWEITALSINKNKGLALSKTLEIPRFKNIFLHIDMPYSVQQKRQIVVYAVVHNYNLRSRRVSSFNRISISATAYFFISYRIDGIIA